MGYSAERTLAIFDWYEKNINSHDPNVLISTIQEGIGHAAALSRYFWPSLNPHKKNKSHKEQLMESRGSKLCKAFGLTDNSPLKNRSIRNTWEHFDERLDRFLVENNAGVFYPQCLIDSHTSADDPTSFIFKLLDKNEKCIVLLNEKYFFQPIINEVKEIYEKAKHFINENGRLPH